MSTAMTTTESQSMLAALSSGTGALPLQVPAVKVNSPTMEAVKAGLCIAAIGAIAMGVSVLMVKGAEAILAE